MTGSARFLRHRRALLRVAGLLILPLLAVAIPSRAHAESGVSRSLLTALEQSAPAANPRVLKLAAKALSCVRRSRPVRTLSVIDYSLPSTQRRLWVFDLQTRQLLFREWVAHGRNTGGNMAEHFSNRPGSHMSSLGTFVTDGTYTGHNGLSLRLKGLDGRFNDEAERRAIVIHGADYVSPTFAKAEGRLGRSYGCPAVRRPVARKIINTLRDEAMVFAYYPDKNWLNGSRVLNDCSGATASNAVAEVERR